MKLAEEDYDKRVTESVRGRIRVANKSMWQKQQIRVKIMPDYIPYNKLPSDIKT